MKAWRLRRSHLPGAEPWRRLAQEIGLDSGVARLAWLRGCDQPEDLAWRLDASWARTTDPHLLPGVDAAVVRVRKAIATGEEILVYGDYDVDGVTATALLIRVLAKLGARCGFFIPNRFSDGYGLHLDCIQELKATRNPGLLISVDCGVRSVEEVHASRELGMDWVITDHHALQPDLPEACAVVHPHLGQYANRGLAGVGVAFKLAQALLDSAPLPMDGDRVFLDGLLKLVAIGTIADMMPLTGENALLVKRGLRALAGANAPGLAALLKAARIEGDAVRAQDIAFGVAPRLNAVGRMGGAEDAVRLLLARDGAEAAALMEKVETLNRDRRTIQRELAAALDPPDQEAFDLVVEPSAHKGVIGIVAGQRMRESGKPTAVCTVLNGMAQCSLRAPAGYDLGELIAQAKPFLASGGGHRAAAGMTFELARLPFVRQVFLKGAALQSEGCGPVETLLDGLGQGSVPEAALLDVLEPFGQAFPPVLMGMDGSLAKPPQAFGQGHWKLHLQGHPEPLTWFFAEDKIAGLQSGSPLRVAATPQDHPRWGRSWVVEGLLGERSDQP